jgi:GAF domain-containing protein
MSESAPSLTAATDLQSALRVDGTAFPFPVELSLVPLVRFWTEELARERPTKAAMAAFIRKELDKAPELAEPIDDLGVVDRHRELVDVLMGAVFSPAFWQQEYGAALIPFQLRSFYATPAFERVFLGDDGRLQGHVNVDEVTVGKLRRLFAYGLILRRIYNIEFDVDYTLIFTARDHDTGLERHFKMEFDWRFVEVHPVGDVPVLDDAVRQRLQSRQGDLHRLAEILPGDKFVLRGFTILRTTDVTDQEVLSAIKRDLIDKESVVAASRFQALQARLQTFFRRPAIHLGLAAIEGDKVLVLNYGAKLEHSCIFADSAHHKTSDFAGSIYERAVREGRPVIVHDVSTEPARTDVDEDFLRRGIRNIVVAPLQYQDRVIGTLELESPNPGDLNATHIPKIKEILPLFSMAVQRSMEELNNRVQAFIKEKCTAIHPVVEWRFRKAVFETLERRSDGLIGSAAEMPPIVFPQVRPLYALSDIRGSSTQRALAIQTDLLTQLRLARQVLDCAYRARSVPALAELRYRVDKHSARIETDLKSGDEVGIIAFVRSKVEPLFGELQEFGPSVRGCIEAYRAAIDPRLGTVYDERRRFEESVTRLTDAISSYLDLEEQAAQSMAPHYFEKQKTDGVDYQIYVGESLVEDGRTDPLALANLRLWQLQVTCGIAVRAEQLRDHLPLPLETAHLILVQHAPLSIRFRFDEKRFDVDGAYDIRYEIVKKRIDKALIKGTSERVTQPGRIVIVYTQAAEAQEYRGYIEYLQHLGELAPGVEDVELEELQGVHGLRALRVTVDLRSALVERRVSIADLHAAPSGPSLS